MTPTKPASKCRDWIKLLLFSLVLFCLCINVSFLLSFRLHFLFSFSFLMPLQPFSTNPYSKMNMLLAHLTKHLSWYLKYSNEVSVYSLAFPQKEASMLQMQCIQTRIEQFQLSSTSLHISLNWQNLTNGKRFHKGAQTNKSQNFHIAPVLRRHRVIILCLWFLLLANSILKYKICLPLKHLTILQHSWS